MFRFISAWLQAVLRYIAAWLPAAAAADDSDAAVASPQAAMDFPVTASLGPLHRPLHSFKATKNNLPDGVSDGQVRRLEEDLETLFTELKIVSEADDPSFTARCWMKEVRELRYDAEDFFSEVLRSSANGGEGATRRGALLWIPSKLKRQRQVAEAFSDLWARAKDASRRRQSFQLGPATIRDEFGQDNVSSRSKSPQLVDLEESMDRLVKVLAFDSEDADQQLQVVPIFGFAGVGKTTLARTFYRNFHGKFQCQAFVRVSRNSDMRMLLSSILSQIKAPPVHAFPDVQDLIDYIREYLQRKRYLIVIDDLWTSSTWDIIRRAFPDGDCCCRIIVTTEIEDVALTCSRYQFKYMYEMSPLNGDQSRQLFLIKVFGSENVCPSDFKEVAYEIIWKCGGLPLAIENIASMLACELKVDQWKHIRDSLPSVLGLRTDPSSEGLKEVLNIIYDNLSPYLKTCLLYLIMYPEGNTISKEDLVKQWVAEDFIGEGQNREQTARDYFDELVSRGMIEPVDINYNDEVLTCTVHHLVLDLITYKSLEENFIINVSYFQTTPGLPDKVRRLSVQFGGAKCASIPADFMMTQVKSLVYFGFYNCVPSVVEYKLLRVLILHIWADESKIFDLTGISELLQLRYLKIDCNITIHLPDEIRQLKFLETLELHAPVNDMPSDISFLPLLSTLGYFDLSKNSVENVQSLGELKNLQDLHLTRSNTEEPDNLKNNMQCLGSILWKLINLKSLTLVPAASSHADVLDDAGAASVGISGDVLSNVSSPPALLQRLELSGRCCIFASLPEWTKELGNLCILKISVRRLLRKDIDILKGMPALMSLSLYVWTVPVGKVVFDNEGFSVLKYFKFTCAAPCVAFLKGALPSVRVLKLAFNANRMEQYGQIVAGLEYLVELREITAKVGGTDADESDKKCAESALSCAIANHPRTPIIRVECVDRIFDAEEDTSVTQEQEHWTLEKQQEIQEELLDALPRLLIPTPSTQTQMRDGGKNEGTDGSVEVLIQEQEHWTLEKQLGIQEEFLDPVPELLSTPSRRTQTRDGVHGEKIERSMEILTHEHLILEKQHEIQEELRYSLPKFPSTPSTQTQARDELQAGEIERLMEVWTQEQEQSTLKKQQEMTDRAEDVQIGKSMEVVAQEENSTLQKQHEVKRELHNPLPELLSIPSTIASYHSTVDSRLSALFAEDAHLVGIDGPRDDLAKWMVEAGNSSAKHHCRVLAIVGFGGLGKTTLANQIYRKTKGHFHCQAFVLASQKPDIKKIIMDLISQVSSHGFTEDIDNWDEERSIAELRELLQDKRYLVVIDDIWSTKAWDIIKCAFPENNYSSRIITTTRSIDVARSCCMGQEDSIYNIQPLSDFHSKKLFFNRIFGYGDGPDMLEDVSNEILEKCGGIPLAIISISSLLANRPVNKEEWEKVRRSIGCAVEKNGSLEGMKSILQLSYNDLSANLKACLVHVAFFSENSVLEREKLVSLWVARGFIYEKSGKNLEEVGEDYFYELINRSIIQAVDICYDGKARACRVHDMVLDLVISKLAEEVTVIGNAQTGSSPWTSDLNLASVLINEEISNVRLLMVTSSSFTEHFPSLAWFGNLCALDLEGCDRLESYNMKGVGMLFQLKYLSLRGTWISHLPPEVVMLHSLEVLDIRDTHIEELSAGIVHLTELRYLIASDYGKAGIKITNAIRNMKNLRVLFCYGINSGSLGALEKLGNLNNLNLKHGKIGSKYTWHSHVELSLHKLGRCKQQSLTIRRMFPNLAKPLGTWSPLLFCHQRFEISGRYNLRCIPERIPPAPNHLTINNHLTYLEINIVEVMEKDLHILGEIPALLHLELTCQTVRKERLTFHGRGFKRLKEFVYDAAVLPSGNLLFTEGALPMLEDLSLIYCVSMVKSYGFFLGIEHLPRLKNAQVRLYKEGATSSDISSAEVAIMNEADAHPNLPRVTMVEHVKREGYCCGECSNTTVTDLL